MSQPTPSDSEVEVARGEREDMRLTPNADHVAKAEPVLPTDDGVRPAEEHSAGSVRLNNPAMPTAEAAAEADLPSAWEALSEDGAAHRRE